MEENNNSQLEPNEDQELEQKLHEAEVDEEATRIKNAYPIGKKIINRMLIYILCAFIYLGINFIAVKNNFHSIRTPFSHSFVSVIMDICYVIAGLCLLFILLLTSFPKFAKKIEKISDKVKKTVFNILDWVSVFPICAVIASFLFAFVLGMSPVSGTSMNYSLHDGDIVISSYTKNIERFDVIIAYVDNYYNKNITNTDEDEYYIKRVIGVPGDKVYWNGSKLYINGEEVDESKYLSSETINHNSGDYNTFNSESNGFVYYIDGIPSDALSVVPDGYYFVMGDNRKVSKDSRMIGLIKKENIVSVVKFHFGNGNAGKVS